MFEDKQSDLLRRFSQEDMFASGLRVALSGLGPFGGILGEFLTQFVPRQRLDRLQDFIDHLTDRLGSVEAEFRARIDSSPPYAALVEETSLAAVRTPSPERRKDLAELLTTGLSRADGDLLEHHAVLRLLDGLNEAQILILMSKGSFDNYMGNAEAIAFLEKHDGLFGVFPPHFGDGEEVRRRWALRKHYDDDLIARGLLADTTRVVKASAVRSLAITDLGLLLLEAIGRPIAVDSNRV